MTQRTAELPLESLMSRYFTLKQQLDIAYRQSPWQSSAIDRLVNEVVATERRIARVSASCLSSSAKTAEHE